MNNKMYQANPEQSALLERLIALLQNQPSLGAASNLPRTVDLPGGMHFDMPQRALAIGLMNQGQLPGEVQYAVNSAAPSSSSSNQTPPANPMPQVPSQTGGALQSYLNAVKNIKDLKPGDENWRGVRNQVKTYGRELGKDFQQYLPKPAERANPVDQKEVIRYREAVNRIGGMDESSDKFDKNKGIIESLGKKYGYQYQNKIPKAASIK